MPGCAGQNRSRAPDDPLLGAAPPPPGPGAQAAAPTPGKPPPGPAGLQPPLPALNSPPSNAALAGGNPPVFDTDHSLRIGNPPGAPPAGPVQGQAPGAGTQARGPAAPVVPPPRNDLMTVNSPGLPDAARLGSYEQAQALLGQRGVTWQRLETVGDRGGEWKFSCSLPNRQNPNISRTYEARGRDYLSAIRAVLDQIDRDR